jgi:hypothetical protein
VTQGAIRKPSVDRSTILKPLLPESLTDFRRGEREAGDATDEGLLRRSRGRHSVRLRQLKDRSVHSDVDNDHYAERDEHVEASCIEDVPESYDGRKHKPGEHETNKEDRLGPHKRGRYFD